jgi:hypothetical protein
LPRWRLLKPLREKTVPSFNGLYYPYIRFRDEGWLKASALYWDTMSRIVPTGHSPEDGDDIKRLEQAGFVRSLDPSGNRISALFIRLLEERGPLLAEKFRIFDHTPDDRLVPIASAKFSHDLASRLHRLGLARLVGRSLCMHELVAAVYMTALAEDMAARFGARPVAANAAEHIAMSGLTVERLISILLIDYEAEDPTHPSRRAQDLRDLVPDVEIEQTMASIAFRIVLPEGAASIPAKDIIDFRKTYTEERGVFQGEIANIIKELDFIRDMQDMAEVQGLLQSEYEKRVAGKLTRLENDMKRAGWDVVDSVMAASFAAPAGLTVALGAMGMTAPAMVAGAATCATGIAYTAWSIMRKRQKSVDNALKPSAESYLYRVKRDLKPKDAIEDIIGTRLSFIA